MVLLELGTSGAKAPIAFGSVDVRTEARTYLKSQRFRGTVETVPVSQNLAGEFERLRLLRVMRVLCALVDLELGCHLAAHLGLRQHALDGLLDDGFGATGEELDEGLFAEAAGESGVAAIELLVSLEAREHDLFGVDDNDVIAHIDVGGVERVELAGEDG